MNKKKRSLFAILVFRFYFVPILLSQKRGALSKVKDFFVLDSYLLNRWIGTYSGSKSWGVLLNHFYQLKAPV